MNIRVPAHIVPYIETLGEDVGIQFLLEFGGSYQYLSERPQERSPIVQFVGLEQTRKLAVRLGLPGSLRIPLAKPFIARHLKAQGATVNDIARRLHVSDVTIRGWLKEGDNRQLRLL